jgi:hypothetical protein
MKTSLEAFTLRLFKLIRVDRDNILETFVIDYFRCQVQRTSNLPSFYDARRVVPGRERHRRALDEKM